MGTTIGNNATGRPAGHRRRALRGPAWWESSLLEVDGGVIEAAQSMGASTMQIIMKVLLPEALPSLINGSAIAATTILGYSAMAGAVGGGGLGKLAIMYGYNRLPDRHHVHHPSVLLIVIWCRSYPDASATGAHQAKADRRISVSLFPRQTAS